MSKLVALLFSVIILISGSFSTYLLTSKYLQSEHEKQKWEEITHYLPPEKIVSPSAIGNLTLLSNYIASPGIVRLCSYEVRGSRIKISAKGLKLPWSVVVYDHNLEVASTYDESSAQGEEYVEILIKSGYGIVALEVIYPDIAWREIAENAANSLQCIKQGIKHENP